VFEGASGGAAAENGFTVSTSALALVAFSFSGDTMPAGNNITATVLDGDVSQDCLSNFVFSDSNGTSLTVDWMPPCDDCV
jgi:hypothetical protein